MKFQIQRELGLKPETSNEAKASNYTYELTEWLVSTNHLVGVEEFSGPSIHRSPVYKSSVISAGRRKHAQNTKSVITYW